SKARTSQLMLALMKTDALTKKQQHLVKELDEMYSFLGLDYWNMKERNREARTPLLELMKNHLIRGEVVFQYTLIDEHLNNQLCNYFFGSAKSHIKLWKTAKFRNFNYHVLEELSLLKKLAFVKSI